MTSVDKTRAPEPALGDSVPAQNHEGKNQKVSAAQTHKRGVSCYRVQGSFSRTRCAVSPSPQVPGPYQGLAVCKLNDGHDSSSSTSSGDDFQGCEGGPAHRHSTAPPENAGRGKSPELAGVLFDTFEPTLRVNSLTSPLATLETFRLAFPLTSALSHPLPPLLRSLLPSPVTSPVSAPLSSLYSCSLSIASAKPLTSPLSFNEASIRVFPQEVVRAPHQASAQISSKPSLLASLLVSLLAFPPVSSQASSQASLDETPSDYKSTEQIQVCTSRQTSEQPSGQTSGQDSQQTSGQDSQQTSGQTPGQTPEQPSEETFGQTPEQPSEGTPEQPSEGTPAQTAIYASIRLQWRNFLSMPLSSDQIVHLLSPTRQPLVSHPAPAEIFRIAPNEWQYSPESRSFAGVCMYLARKTASFVMFCTFDIVIEEFSIMEIVFRTGGVAVVVYGIPCIVSPSFGEPHPEIMRLIYHMSHAIITIFPLRYLLAYRREEAESHWHFIHVIFDLVLALVIIWSVLGIFGHVTGILKL